MTTAAVEPLSGAAVVIGIRVIFDPARIVIGLLPAFREPGDVNVTDEEPGGVPRIPSTDIPGEMPFTAEPLPAPGIAIASAMAIDPLLPEAAPVLSSNNPARCDMTD